MAVRAALISAPLLFAGLLGGSVLFAPVSTHAVAAQAGLGVCPLDPSCLPLPTPTLDPCALLPTPLPGICPTPTPNPTPTPPTNTGGGGPTPNPGSGGGPTPPPGLPGQNPGPGSAPGGGTTSAIAPGTTTVNPVGPPGLSAAGSISTPFPTGGVLGFAAPALPTPVTFAGTGPSDGSGQGGSGPGSHIALPPILNVASPDTIALTPESLAVSLVVAVLLLLLLAVPAELLRATIRENRDGIRRRLHLDGNLSQRWGNVLAQLPLFISLSASVLVGALLYAFLDPGFGPNLTTAAEVLGLVGALLVLTFAHDVARGSYVRRRFGSRGRLTAFPAGIAFAVGLVLVSRIFHLQPGLIFGFMTGLAFSKRLADRDQGHGLAAATFIVLLVSFVAWFAWVPVKNGVAATADPGFWMITLDTLLVTIWVAGVQSIIFALIPLRFMDGEKVIAWSRMGWAVIYVLTLFIFVQTILQPTTERFGQRNSLMALASLLALFTVFSASVWAFSALRLRRFRRAPATSG